MWQKDKAGNRKVKSGYATRQTRSHFFQESRKEEESAEDSDMLRTLRRGWEAMARIEHNDNCRDDTMATSRCIEGKKAPWKARIT